MMTSLLEDRGCVFLKSKSMLFEFLELDVGDELKRLADSCRRHGRGGRVRNDFDLAEDAALYIPHKRIVTARRCFNHGARIRASIDRVNQTQFESLPKIPCDVSKALAAGGHRLKPGAFIRAGHPRPRGGRRSSNTGGRRTSTRRERS